MSVLLQGSHKTLSQLDWPHTQPCSPVAPESFLFGDLKVNSNSLSSDTPVLAEVGRKSQQVEDERASYLKLDWRMKLSLCPHPCDPWPRWGLPSQDSPCSPGRPGRALQRPCKDSSEHSAGARGLQGTSLDPSPAQWGGLRGSWPADSRSLSPLHCLVRRPGSGGCSFLLLIQPAVPVGSPTSSLCLYPGALRGSSWPWPVPPGAMSRVWTKNQVPWPMRRLPLPPQAVHTHIHTLTHTLLQISIIHSANKQKIRLQDQTLRNYPQVLKDIYLLCINYRFCFVKPKNTEVGSLSLLQGNLPTQELNQTLLHCRGVFTSWATQEALHMATYIYNSLF